MQDPKLAAAHAEELLERHWHKTFLINHYNHLDDWVRTRELSNQNPDCNVQMQLLIFGKSPSTVRKVVRPPICKEVWVSPSANVGDKM